MTRIFRVVAVNVIAAAAHVMPASPYPALIAAGSIYSRARIAHMRSAAGRE